MRFSEETVKMVKVVNRQITASVKRVSTLSFNRLTVLTALIIILSALLVHGRHFAASWAGGEGYRSRTGVVTVEYDDRPEATCDDVDVSRKNILTCSGERRKITFGSSTIWIDENTALVITNDREGSESLAFYTGRIVVNGPVTIQARDLDFSTTGSMTLVNYGWLQRIDALVTEGIGVMNLEGAVTSLDSGKAMSFDTVPPYDTAKSIDFNTSIESINAFYDWAKN
ncbi:MAG: hypothetical protein AAB839_01900 [Patescibacteria group bacterium]